MLKHPEKNGLIKEGQYKNWLITIVDDKGGATNGYYLIIKSGDQAFDYWFESREQLNNQLMDFEVKWY